MPPGMAFLVGLSQVGRRQATIEAEVEAVQQLCFESIFHGPGQPMLLQVPKMISNTHLLPKPTTPTTNAKINTCPGPEGVCLYP